jgi:hypothetical protein
MGMGSQALAGIAFAAAALVATACSKDDGGNGTIGTSDPPGSSEPTTTTLPACSDEQHVAIFDIFGTLTPAAEDVIDWLGDPDDVPEARPYAATVVEGYRKKGYTILYYTGLNVNSEIGGQPVPDAVMGWLASHDFPTEGTVLETSSTDDPRGELGNDLTTLAGTGVRLDVAYTDNVEDLDVYILGGASQVYKLGPDTDPQRSTVVPNDDMNAHMAVVEAIPPVCTA